MPLIAFRMKVHLHVPIRLIMIHPLVGTNVPNALTIPSHRQQIIPGIKTRHVPIAKKITINRAVTAFRVPMGARRMDIPPPSPNVIWILKHPPRLIRREPLPSRAGNVIGQIRKKNRALPGFFIICHRNKWHVDVWTQCTSCQRCPGLSFHQWVHCQQMRQSRWCNRPRSG